MSKKILIVDDEVDMVDLLRMRLEVLGYKVLSAHDGESGLAMVKAEKPDLIMLDVMMPKMNGYEVYAEIKKDDMIKNIPIIMLTAKGQQRDIEKGKELGADIYITKPFDSKDLVAKIEEMLNR